MPVASMTVLELLRSPFRIVETIIRNHLTASLPESTVAELNQLCVASEEEFIITITAETDSAISTIAYTNILPALHRQLSHELLYGQIIGLLPAEVITKLQGKLPEFPPEAPAINWPKLILIFLEIHQYATENTQIAGQKIGPVDLWVRFAYTSTLLHLSHENLDYDEDRVAHEFQWIIEQIRTYKHEWQHLFYTVLEEETDLSTVVAVKHNAQKLVRGVSDYLYSPLLPDWVRNPEYPAAKTVKILGGFAGRLAEIQTMIEERKKYNIALKPIKQEYESFTALFRDPNETTAMVGILREVSKGDKKRKSVIDDAGRWIGKRGSYSILIAWIEVLQERGKFKANLPDSVMATLLNGYFLDLNLDTVDTSIWRKLTDTRNTYHAEFLQLIK